MDNKVVIFDLDGTLALIDTRRDISMVTLPDGMKRDWDIFFDPKNIELDVPNIPVVTMAQLLKSQGYTIVIFSGRSKATKDATNDWLKKYDVPCDVLKMRPTSNPWHYMKDSDLKKHWLDDIFPDKSVIFAVFDDRQQVVDMWRDNGLTVFQVADGDF